MLRSHSSEPLSRTKAPGPKQDDMICGDRNVSPPAPLHGETGSISGFSAATGGAGGGDVGRSMKPDKELALASVSSAATVGSPPPPSKSLKGSEVDAEGSKTKRKEAVLDASGVHRCSLCGKSFKSSNAVNGHMRVHKTPLKQRKLNTTEGSEMKGDGGFVTEGGASSPAVEARRKKIHMELDLNKEAPEDDDNDDED